MRYIAKITLSILCVLAVMLTPAGANADNQLWVAIENCNLPEIKRLIADGAKVNIGVYPSPLYKSVRCGSSEIVTALINAGADINEKDNTAWKPLHKAAAFGYLEIVIGLIQAGADVNAEAHGVKETPLYVAAFNGRSDTVIALIEAGANINAKDKYGYTPLHKVAIDGRSTETAIVLIQAGADINAKTSNKFTQEFTPLHIATETGQTEIAIALIKAGANINEKTNIGFTPLHIAAAEGQTETAIMLIQAGASINAGDNDGWTPLHAAAFYGQPDIAIILIEAGAYIPATDNSGWTSLELAKHKKNWSVVSVLENPPPVRRRPQPVQPPQGESAPNVAIAPPPETAGTAEFVFENAWRSIVFITDSESQGSGVIIRPNIVATNCHVVEDGNIKVYKAANRNQKGNEAFPATVRRWDEDNDFCLLDVPGLWGISANVRKYDTLRVGENVYGIGAPQGFDLSISSGLISQLRVREGNRKMIQTDAAISPGSSGGGLFDREGNLIGIMTSKWVKEGVEGIGFAIPADLALE